MLLTAICALDKELPPLPEPQRLDAGTSDPAARSFLWLGGCETGFGAPAARLVDDDHNLSIVTRGIPMWFIIACLLMPIFGLIGFMIYEWLNNRDTRFMWFMLLLSPLIVVELVSFFRWLNRKARDGIARATLHRDTAMLEIHDYNLMLSRHAISDLLLVRGRQRKKDKEGIDITWARELSVVATNENGERLRWHVVTAACKQIERFADEVARTLGVAVTRCKAK